MLALAVANAPARAQSQPTVVEVPPGDNGQKAVQLETFFYQPSGSGPFPLVILSHGSAGGNARRSLPSRNEAEFFTGQGFAVLVPMRRGRGKSTGISREYEDRHCETQAWEAGLRDAMQEIDAVLVHAQSLPQLDISKVILAGVSRGGFLSVAYAAQGAKRTAVKAVVNFVGGWVAQAEDRCPQDFNLQQFALYGKSVRAPGLWLYGAQDLFYGDDAIRTYVDAYRAGGAPIEFELISGIPGNGHWLPQHRERWEGPLRRFLDSLP